MKVLTTAANGYAYFSSINFPRLLDFMGKSVTFKAWCRPEVVNEGFLEIYTLKADGTTAQTLTSTTTCPAGKFTLLELENQSINNDIVLIELRFKVAGNGKYAYFDDSFAISDHQYEYILPSVFQTGTVKQVHIQQTGYSNDPCYDLLPINWGPLEEFEVMQNGDYNASGSPPIYSLFRLKNLPPNFYRMRLIGMSPLESLTADTSTIYLDGEKLNLIVAKVVSLLYKLIQGPVASEDKGRFATEIAYWEREVARLKGSHGMMMPAGTLWTGR